MVKIAIPVEKRNGGSREKRGPGELLQFVGREVAVFRVPYDGEERVGSMGIDFALYQDAAGKFILVVENWSRRPGGRNSRTFEVFDSLEEMKEKVIYEDSYAVELPRKLLQRAEKHLAEAELPGVLYRPGKNACGMTCLEKPV